MENINFVLFCFELELWVLLSPLLIKAILGFMWRVLQGAEKGARRLVSVGFSPSPLGPPGPQMTPSYFSSGEKGLLSFLQPWFFLSASTAPEPRGPGREGTSV